MALRRLAQIGLGTLTRRHWRVLLECSKQVSVSLKQRSAQTYCLRQKLQIANSGSPVIRLVVTSFEPEMNSG